MAGVISTFAIVGCGLLIVSAIAVGIVIALFAGGGDRGISGGEASAIDFLLFFDDETDPDQPWARRRRGGRR